MSARNLAEQFDALTGTLMDSVQTSKVRMANADYFGTLNGGSIADPLKLRGFFMRCDLDGFTPQVQAAFEAAERTGSDAPINALVLQFLDVLRYPSDFKKRFGIHFL